MKKFFSSLLATILAFGFILLIPATPAHALADTCTWDGSSSADWSDGTNWTGCDNGGVPEAGDTLIFPPGASNPATNNDLGVLLFDSVVITGNGYTLGGNDINIVNILQFTGDSNTVTSNINITGTASATLAVSGGATGNIIDGNIDLALTGGADMNTDVNEDITHNGAITGSADTSFQQTGTNTWITSTTNPSTFTASVNISSGSFQCNNNNCFGADANAVSNNSGGALQFNNGALVIANNITLASSTSPQLNVMSGSPELTGTFTVNATGTVYVQGASLTVSGATTLNADLNTNGSSATASSIYLNGNIAGASVGNVIADNSFLGVSGNNAAYGGDFTAMPGAAIEAFSSDSFGDTVGTTTIQSGATLYSDSTITVGEPITVSGTGVGSGNFTGAIVQNLGASIRNYSGTITLAGNTTIKSTGGTLTFSGSIDGTGDLTIDPGGPAYFVVFSGSTPNSYSGTTTVNNAGLSLAKNFGVIAVPGDIALNSTTGLAQLQANGGEQIADTSNLTMSETTYLNTQVQIGDTETVGSTAGAGSISIIPGETFTTGGNNTSTTFAGRITSQAIVPFGILNKVGTGTFTLTGSSFVGFEPTFVVNGGVLAVNSNFATVATTANSGGTLGGSGMAGSTAINSGGKINAGNSPGCITVASLTLGAGSTFEEEIAGGTACTEYDQTTVTGNANLGGATLTTLPTYTPTPGTVFTILQANTISGTFNELVNGATFTANGIQFRINYNTSAQSGHTVTLTVLGGTLVPTGQNHNGVAYLASAVLLLGLGSLYYGFRRNKFSIKRSSL